MAHPAWRGSLQRPFLGGLLPLFLLVALPQLAVKFAAFPALQRGLRRWLPPLQMAHPLEKQLWYPLGLLLLRKKWFQMGCLSDPGLNCPLYLLGLCIWFDP